MKTFLILIITCFFGGKLVAQSNSLQKEQTPQLTSQKSYKGVKDSGKIIVTLKKVIPKLKSYDYKDRISEKVKSSIISNNKISSKRIPRLMSFEKKRD